ncbi:hypothetical protein B0T25DRAFT_449538 [Lasiosphaeria hispida]|uniref:Cip1-like core domain-containing protein n=1 Tax=Lasiosphaeria hispida TaxID=260671 RepID=A0AAJ0HST0_9PEZI|nr:hypothetical protein B0T25DRAFT_449538 [Lasiosphaeria hispida]
MFFQAVLLAFALIPSSLGQIAEGFENGWDQKAWPIYTGGCNQGGTVSLDSSTAHSGSNSIKVVAGASGYCGHAFFGTTNNIPKGDIYVRVYLKALKALTQNHISLIIMPDSSQGSNKHLRIGGQDKVLTYNRESDDAVLPDLSSQGIATSVALPTGVWQCFEYHVSSDGTIETWLEGKAIPGLTVVKSGTNTHASIWGKNYKPIIGGVYFGWEAYGGDANTFWYDDIAIGPSRPGCLGS